MNDGAETPDVALLGDVWFVGGDPFVGAAARGLVFEGGEAEVADDDVRDGAFGGDGAAEEDVGGFHVAVDGAFPAPVGTSGRVAHAGAVVEICQRVSQLDEDVPDVIFGEVSILGDLFRQIPPFAVFEIQYQRSAFVHPVGAIEFQDVGVRDEDFFEEIHFAGFVAEHAEFLLRLAYESFVVFVAAADLGGALTALAKGFDDAVSAAGSATTGQLVARTF